MIKNNTPASGNNILISQPSIQIPKIRLIDVILEDSKKTESSMTSFANFTVQESGYYNISLQLVLHALGDTSVDCVQYGVCMTSSADFSEVFSSIGSQILSDQCYLSSNLSTVKFMEKGTNYQAWYNVLLLSGEMSYLKEHSKLKLIKL